MDLKGWNTFFNGKGTGKEGSTDYAYRLGGTEGAWEVCHFVSVNWG